MLSGVTGERRDGYDRIVYTFSGPAGSAPGWQAGYVDQPVQEASGEPVTLGGSAFLQVLLTGTTSEGPTGAPPYTGRQTPPGLALVREVVGTGTFEGQTQAFVGVGARAPFRVLALTGPTRVVVDVRTR